MFPLFTALATKIFSQVHEYTMLCLPACSGSESLGIVVDVLRREVSGSRAPARSRDRGRLPAGRAEVLPSEHHRSIPG